MSDLEKPSGSDQHEELLAGRYRLEDELVRRGDTQTWRAFDTRLSRSVLVHVLESGSERSPKVLDAAKQAAMVNDSRFLKVLDAVAPAGTGHDPSLVVCEFVPGCNLEQLLASGPLTAIEAGWLVRELADALASRHKEGQFHEHLNPDTVVVTTTGNIKIVGFLIEDALHPEGASQLPWSQRESVDVQALGQLLYACLVARWPIPASDPRHYTFGMPPAPTDSHGWRTPRQVNPGVSPALDEITDQILARTPLQGAQPLQSASQVAAALSKVLGTANAAPDLERRLRHRLAQAEQDTMPDGRSLVGSFRTLPVPSLPTPQAPTSPAQDSNPTLARRPDDPTQVRPATQGGVTQQIPAARSLGTTQQIPAAQPTSPGLRPGTGPGAGANQTQATAPVTAGLSALPAVSASATPAAAVRGREGAPASRMRGGSRRWIVLLSLLVVAGVLIGVIAHALQSSGSSGTGTTSHGTGAPVTIATAADFDPVADGGNGSENSSQVPLAYDANATSAWHTVTYLSKPTLGGLKPGVGLVLDLGKSVAVSKVTVTLVGSPTSLQLMVPASNAATATSAPMTSVKAWSSVASQSDASTTAVLTPSSPVTTRFLLVYLTSLPAVSSHHYQGGIANLAVTS